MWGYRRRRDGVGVGGWGWCVLQVRWDALLSSTMNWPWRAPLEAGQRCRAPSKLASVSNWKTSHRRDIRTHAHIHIYTAVVCVRVCRLVTWNQIRHYNFTANRECNWAAQPSRCLPQSPKNVFTPTFPAAEKQQAGFRCQQQWGMQRSWAESKNSQLIK